MGRALRYITKVPKQATDVSTDEELLAEAGKLQVNVPRAAEFGLARAMAEKRAEIWLRENQEALESSNEYVEKHGLPLAKYRQF